MKAFGRILGATVLVAVLSGSAYAGQRLLVTPVLTRTAFEIIVCQVNNGSGKTIMVEITRLDGDGATIVGPEVITIEPGKNARRIVGGGPPLTTYCKFRMKRVKGVVASVHLEDQANPSTLVVAPAQ